MDKEKQIKEIFKDLCEAPIGVVNEDFTIGTMKDSHTDLCIRTIAGHLYAKGYRKERQGEWKEIRIVRYNGTKPYTQFAHECSNCKWLNKHTKGWSTKYCPNCGARMKGE